MNKLNDILLLQQTHKRSNSIASVPALKSQLKDLLVSFLKHETQIAEALKLDMNKNPTEVYLTEFMPVINELKWFIKHLHKIHTTHNKSTVASLLMYRNYETRKAHGNVLIYSTYNYPLQLSMIPLIGAIACNNTVMLKLAEQPIHTNKIIIKILSQIFSTDQCYVIDPALAPIDLYTTLYDLKVDMVFFTGSYKIGQKIYENYAKQMIPVVLELGGKSPVIIEPSCNLKQAAKRLVWGKMLNCGQTCVAPDHIIIHTSIVEQFLFLFTQEFKLQFPSETLKHDVVKCSPQQTHRFNKLLEGKTLYSSLELNDETNLSLISCNDFNDPLWKEELFGPLLPITIYETEQDIYKIINHNPNPLALYIFSNNKRFVDTMHGSINAGSTAVNDCVMHLNSPMPFGGVKKSGIGKYHGQHSVDCFTRIQPLVKCTKIDIGARYTPTTNKKYKFLKKFLG